MDGIFDIIQFATGSIEGVALVEIIILFVIGAIWRELRSLSKRVENHEGECTSQFADGSKKMALMSKDIGYIKRALNIREDDE